MLVHLFTWWCYVSSYMHYVFPAVMFIITSGRGIRTIILLYWVMSTYDRITSLVMRLSWYLYVALLLCLYLGRLLSEFISNCTQSMGKAGGDTFSHSFTSPFSFRLITTAFENFEYPWDVQASMLLLLCLLNVSQVLFRVTKNFLKICPKAG